MSTKILPDKRYQFLADSYWIVDQGAKDFPHGPMPPCGYPLIEFNLGTPQVIKQAHLPALRHTHMAIGISHHPINLVSQHPIQSIVVRLTPWAMPMLARASRDGNCVFSLDEVLGNTVQETEERLREASSHASLKKILDEFIGHTLGNGNNRQLDERIVYAIHYIIQHKGNIRITELTREFNIGQKRLEQLFNQTLGCSPKTYAEIAQVNYAFSLFPHEKQLTHLSLDAGYYDQSHFIRACKKMTGLTPSSFRKAFKRDQEFLVSNLYNS